jgi:uroporphyrin-3 C-methyltransferase
MAEEESEERGPSRQAEGGVGLQQGLLVAALVLALFSSGYVGYRVYLETTRVDPLEELRAQVAGQLSEHGDRLEALNRSLSEENARQADAMVMVEDELATLRERLDETVRQMLEAGPPSEREWKIAEVEYLLRIANHRVKMEQDVGGALELVRAADAVLESLDDFSMHEVRAELAREINALKTVPGLDVTGIYVRIDALGDQIARLQVRMPFELAPDAEGEALADEPERSVWAAIAERLLGLVRIRVGDALPRRPQLSGEEVQYLEQLLLLQLEQAKIGLLRKDQTLYTGSLKSAAMWVKEYFDGDDPVSVLVLEELAALQEIELVADLPDISGSLNLLRELRRVERG